MAGAQKDFQDLLDAIDAGAIVRFDAAEHGRPPQPPRRRPEPHVRRGHFRMMPDGTMTYIGPVVVNQRA